MSLAPGRPSRLSYREVKTALAADVDLEQKIEVMHAKPGRVEGLLLER